MISNDILVLLVNRFNEIADLASQYGLDEISLLHPRYNDSTSKLYFAVSRKEKWMLFDEAFKFRCSLCDLLGVKIGDMNDNMHLDVKEAFVENYLTDTYHNTFSIFPRGQASRNELVDFVKKDLGFSNYLPALRALEQQDNSPEVFDAQYKEVVKVVSLKEKRKNISDISTMSQVLASEDTDVKSPAKKQRTLDLGSTQEEKSRAGSPVSMSSSTSQPLLGVFFSSSKRQEGTPMNDALSLEQQQAVREAAQILKRHMAEDLERGNVMLACVAQQLGCETLLRSTTPEFVS